MDLFLPPAPPPLTEGPVALMRVVEIKEVAQAIESVERQGLSEADLFVQTKFNGWLTQIVAGRLWSRRGNLELTRKFPEIAGAITQYDNDHLIGELVYWGPDGVMDAPSVTTVAGTANPEEAVAKLKALPGHFQLVVFGALAVQGYDVTALGAWDRYGIVTERVRPTEAIRIPATYPFRDWERVYEEALRLGGDGVILKNAFAPYLWRPLGETEPKPYGNQFKVKPVLTEDFVVFDAFPGPRGKLIVKLGQYWKGRLIPVSEMNNFSKEMEAEVKRRLAKGPFVMEVLFQARFPDAPGSLQHPRFGRLRDDLLPRDIELPAEYAPR